MDGSMRRKIESVYGSLRPSERKAADYLLEYRGRAGDLLMEELAGAAGVSQPTVMRFVKALGYSGFREFKYALVQEEARGQRKEGEIELYGFQLSSRDRLEKIPGKIVATSIRMLEETLKNFSKKTYRKVIEALTSARLIDIYGVENSEVMAMDLLTKLLYLGLPCRHFSDCYLQQIAADRRRHAGVVHQRLQRTEPLQHRRQQRLAVLPRRNVRAHVKGADAIPLLQLRRPFRECLRLVTAAERHVPAFRRQFIDDSGADSAAAPRYQCRLAHSFTS